MQKGEIGVTLQIAATYIGTVVGAGFASGQEVLQFFTRYGSGALAAIGLTGILFFALGVYALSIGKIHGVRTFGEVAADCMSPRVGQTLSGLLIILLFGVTVAMLAGGGALLYEQFGIPFPAGALLTAGLTFVTLLTGMRGMMSANSVIVPLLIGLVATIGFLTFWRAGHLALPSPPVQSSTAAPWQLIVSACTYAGFNIGLSLTVLVPLGQIPASRNSLLAGALLGAAGLTGLLVILHLLLVAIYPHAFAFEVPMGYIAKRLPQILRYGFVAVLWGEIYSTLVGNVFGMASEITVRNPRNFLPAVAIILSVAYAVCQIGFAPIVTVAYPLFGYLGLMILAALFFSERRILKL